MELQLGKKNKKLNVTTWTWDVIIGIIIAIIAISIITYRYTVTGVDSAYQWNTEFATNKTMATIETVKHWTAGDIYYGIN